MKKITFTTFTAKSQNRRAIRTRTPNINPSDKRGKELIPSYAPRNFNEWNGELP